MNANTRSRCLGRGYQFVSISILLALLTLWGRDRALAQSPPPLSDSELLDRTEVQTARYFWDQALTNGFVRDLNNSPHSSIAATGFGLAALVVMAERYGSSPEWTVTRTEAEGRARAILDTAVAIQELQDSNPSQYGKAGFLYHFVDQNGQRYGSSEVSTVDMAILLVGALTAGQYFGGEVQAHADEFFGNIDWSYFLAGDDQFHHAWQPEQTSDFGVTPPDMDGYLSNQKWDRPSDEVLLISLLALASDLDNEAFRRSLYSWPRVTRSYAGYDVVNSYFGSLFTYIFAHAFFDFGAMGFDDPDSAGMSVPSVNWFDNSRRAALANRQFAIDHSGEFPTYGPDQWGLSACYRPGGSYFGDNGAKPAEVDGGEPRHDGTVPPYGAISSMPLVGDSSIEALTDNLAFQALRNYYDNHFQGLWGLYGPRDSFETQLIDDQPVSDYSDLYVGIDVGPEVLMIENYRTGLVQQQVMSHPNVLAAAKMQFPKLQPVGGTSEFPQMDQAPSESGGSAGRSVGVLAAAAVGVGAIAASAAIWYVGRRQLK